MLSNVVGFLLCLALLVMWLGARREDRIAVQRACRHRWTLESLYDEGHVWHRRCELCGKQEPVGGSGLGPERAPLRRRRSNRHDRDR